MPISWNQRPSDENKLRGNVRFTQKKPNRVPLSGLATLPVLQVDLSHSSSDGSDKDGQVKEHAWEEKRQHNEERHRLTGLGYFVFPPGGWNVAEERPQNEENSPRKGLDNLDRSEKDRQAKEHAWEERLRRSEEARSKLLEQVQEEGRKGEIEWVRSGGILRDAYGRRDDLRTESIKREIRLQKDEQLAMEQWEAYEGAWRSLLTSTDSITFNTLPWPLQKAPSTVHELTPTAISEFLLASLAVRTNSVTRKERIRASFLRWHPDKISSVLNRVVDDDVDAVREGISAVLMCLKDLAMEKGQI